MNWLLIPHIGKRTVRGESNFVLYLDIARHFASRGDYVHILVDAEAGPQDLPFIEHVFYLRVKPPPTDLTYYARMAILPQPVIEECNQRSGCRMIDAIITSRPFLVLTAKAALSSVDAGFIPTIYLEPGADDKLRRIRNEGFTRAMAQAWVNADKCMTLTEHEENVVLAELRKYCASTEVREFMDSRSLVLPVGVPTDAVDPFKGLPKHHKFTLFFGARVSDVKQVDQIAKLYNMIYKSGRDVRIVFCTPVQEAAAIKCIGAEVLRENKAIEVHGKMGRNAYLGMAAESHVFISMSKWEGFPVGFWEQMYLGLVGLFPRKPWALGQLPKEYPFWFDSLEDAYTQLAWIIDHYEEAKAKVAFMEPLIKEKYDKRVVWDRLRDEGVSMAMEPKQWHMIENTKVLVNEAALMLGPQFSMTDLITYTVS